jgi:uncharacterized protein (DUF2147 family)
MNRHTVNWLSGLMAVLFFSSCTVAQTEGDSIIGQWYTEGCQAIFDFYRCGQEYRARLYPLKKPDLVDSNNRTDSLKNRKLNGETTVFGLVYDPKKRRWGNGKVYNPQDGRTYSCQCWFVAGGTQMRFRGYIGISILGGSQTWTRELCGK